MDARFHPLALCLPYRPCFCFRDLTGLLLFFIFLTLPLICIYLDTDAPHSLNFSILICFLPAITSELTLFSFDHSSLLHLCFISCVSFRFPVPAVCSNSCTNSFTFLLCFDPKKSPINQSAFVSQLTPDKDTCPILMRWDEWMLFLKLYLLAKLLWLGYL